MDWIFILECILYAHGLFLGVFLAIDDPYSGIIRANHLEYFPRLKEGLKHVPFFEYFIRVGRVNRVQVNIFNVGDEKVYLSPEAIKNKWNILGMSHSYPCVNNFTYCAVTMVTKDDVEGVYV